MHFHVCDCCRSHFHLIYIYNFHVLRLLLLIYICKPPLESWAYAIVAAALVRRNPSRSYSCTTSRDTASKRLPPSALLRSYKFSTALYLSSTDSRDTASRDTASTTALFLSSSPQFDDNDGDDESIESLIKRDTASRDTASRDTASTGDDESIESLIKRGMFSMIQLFGVYDITL